MEKDFTFDEIEEYLAGTVSEETALQIESEIKNNPSFAAVVEKHRRAHALVHNYAIGQLKNKVKKIHQEGSGLGTSSFTPWMKIAASLVFFLVVGGYLFVRNEYSDDQLFSDSFAAFPNQFNVMGSEEKNFFTEGLRHYDNREYEKAIASFKNIPHENEYAVPAQLYSGVSYLALEQADSAVSILHNLLLEETTYSEAIRWYLALAHLKNGDDNNAIALLEVTVQQNGFQAQQAEKLLQKLKSPLKRVPGI